MAYVMLYLVALQCSCLLAGDAEVWQSDNIFYCMLLPSSVEQLLLSAFGCSFCLLSLDLA